MFDKKTWEIGETVSASDMNRIENAIDDLTKRGASTEAIENIFVTSRCGNYTDIIEQGKWKYLYYDVTKINKIYSNYVWMETPEYEYITNICIGECAPGTTIIIDCVVEWNWNTDVYLHDMIFFKHPTNGVIHCSNGTVQGINDYMSMGDIFIGTLIIRVTDDDKYYLLIDGNIHRDVFDLPTDK